MIKTLSSSVFKIFSISILLLMISTEFNFGEKTYSFETEEFKKFWYSGQAELTSYKLEQARYGEIHEGYAVLVFVTEDFSLKKHVKLDNPNDSKEDSVKVLKLNLIKKFNTGIYRYSMMTSIFTPTHFQEFPYSLKDTTTSQEWCGHTFTQLNLDGNFYDVKQYSYFESEGDEEYEIEKALLEDSVWNMIRIDPKTLPTGKVKIIPSTLAARLTHIKPEVRIATAELNPDQSNDELLNYSITYKNPSRKLKITFQKDFPYEITEWEESYISGWGPSAKELTTKAVRNKSIKVDYWNKNRDLDTKLRKDLGLDN